MSSRGREQGAASSRRHFSSSMLQVWSAVSRFLRWRDIISSRSGSSSSSSSPVVNLEDEYQKACRTESYLEFTKRAHILLTEASSSSPRTPSSLEVLAATLLEPDQDKVLSILMSNKDVRRKPELFQLVSDYFEHSTKASNLCTLLLKAIDATRERCQDMKGLLSTQKQQQEHQQQQQQQQQEQAGILRELHTLLLDGSGSSRENPLLSSRAAAAFSQGHFQPVRERYVTMQDRLERIRRKATAKLRAATRCLKACTFLASAGCICLLVATTAALFMAVAALVLGCKAFTFPVQYVARRASGGRRRHRDRAEQQWRQSEAVAQGTFVVLQDLDTIKRLVARLASEVESATRTLAFCSEHQEDGVLLSGALGQVCRSSTVLEELLDDLEVSLYLCFMSINKARALVVRELCLNLA